MRRFGRFVLAASTCLLFGCPLHWVVLEQRDGDPAQALTQRHRAQLERAAMLLNQAKVPIAVRETRLLNFIGFENAHQATVLAIYTNGQQVTNNMTRFQRAMASFGEEAQTVLRALDSSGLLEANPDYARLKLGQFYRVRDSIMTSDIGSVITAENESAVFYFPLATAKAFAEQRVPFKELMSQSLVEGEDGQPITGHLY